MNCLGFIPIGNITTMRKEGPPPRHTKYYIIISKQFQILDSAKKNLELSVAFMAAVFLVMFPPTSLSPLSLLNLHIISRKEAEPAMALSYPPALVNLGSTVDS